MTFAEVGISEVKEGRYSTICPQCSASRKVEHRKTPCLTVWNTPDNKGWNCSHCGWRGNLATHEKYDKVREHARMPKARPLIYSKEVNEFLASKQISPETAYQCGCYEREGFGGVKEICFPYYYGNSLVNVMYRPLGIGAAKKVYQVPTDMGAKSCFWGLEMIDWEFKEITITEGQTDRMTLIQNGFKNILSVPMGAPNPTMSDLKKKLSYAHDEAILDKFKTIEKFHLFTDNDTNGIFLREKLAEILGIERCYIPWYPYQYKDSNEVYAGDIKKGLEPMGKKGIEKMYEMEKPWHIPGIITVSVVKDELERLATNGFDRGLISGVDPIDKLYRVRKKILLGISGVPGAAKSSYFRWHLTEQLKKNPSLEMAGYTPESRPMSREYAKIAEVVAGERFEPNWQNTMNADKRRATLEYVEKHITLVSPDVHNFHEFAKKVDPSSKNNNPRGLRSILSYMVYLKKEKGIFGFWIDAWNKLDHQRGNIPAEEFISRELDFLLEFLDKEDLFCCIIAHPTKMERVRGGNFRRPSLYDIKGSSAWNEKLDIGLIIHRNLYKKTNRRDENDEEIWEIDKNAPNELVCEKMKFDELGEVGSLKLWMDKKAGDRFMLEDPAKETYETKRQKKKKTKIESSANDDEEEEKDEKEPLDTDELPF